MGLFDRPNRRRLQELEAQLAATQQELATLKGEMDTFQLTGRLKAVENQARAAHDRCERNENRLGKLEHTLSRQPWNEAQTETDKPLPPFEALLNQHPEGVTICTQCEGRGTIGGIKRADNLGVHTIGMRVCDLCQGKGYVPKLNSDAFLAALEQVPTKRKACPTCRGTGTDPTYQETGPPNTCPSCAGKGHLDVPV